MSSIQCDTMAVMVGWMALMWFVVQLAAHPSETVRSWARRALIASTAIWFTFHAGFSVAIGEKEHAAFNLPFLPLLAGPLYIMASSDTTSEDKKGQ